MQYRETVRIERDTMSVERKVEKPVGAVGPGDVDGW